MPRLQLEMRTRICDITSQRRNSKCMKVSKAGNRSHKVQAVNLQHRRIYWEEGNAYIRIRIANRTWRTIEKNGLHETAKKYGIDLMKYVIPGAKVPNDMPSVSTIKAESVARGQPPSAVPKDHAKTNAMLREIARLRQQQDASQPARLPQNILDMLTASTAAITPPDFVIPQLILKTDTPKEGNVNNEL
jgi:large subunit ribosomal protein L28